MKWKEDNESSHVRAENSGISCANVWNIEILEKFTEIRGGMENIYIQYLKRSSTNPDFACPVKTRAGQSPPRSDQRVVMILEGSHLIQGHYIGKALIEMQPEHSYDFNNVDYDSLINNRELATYTEEDSVSVEDADFERVVHNGWCGFNCVGQSLGFPIRPDDPDFVGKMVFKRLVESGYDFKCIITEDIMNSDCLESKFWMNSDMSKFSFISYHLLLTNLFR